MGRPIGSKNKNSLKQRFYAKIKKTNSCWIWIGAKSKHQNPKFCYGVMRLNGILGGNTLSHRISWEIHNGKIPPKMCVLHKCDVPLCVRPSHLWIGTQLENIADRVKKGRTIYQSGESNHFSKLKNKNILKIRSLYASGKFTQVAIGKKYGVTHRAIGKIISRENWNHIT